MRRKLLPAPKPSEKASFIFDRFDGDQVGVL
jgi:hypothetical protein